MAVITLRWARLGAAPFFIWYVTLLHFAEKHRDCKALAFRLTFEEHPPMLIQKVCVAPALFSLARWGAIKKSLGSTT
jgi:hypothetical protein